MNSLIGRFATGPAAPALADGAQIDALYRRYRFQVLVAITIGYAFAYTCRLALSVVKKPLIDEGIFSPEDLGLIGSALFYTYALGKLVNGFLADLQVWGTPDQVADKLLDYVRRTDAGAVLTALSFGGMPPDVATANYDLFTTEVLPVLQAHDVGGDIGVTHDALAVPVG